jgi:RNA polymerase sigma factor (sigma-70 family)
MPDDRFERLYAEYSAPLFAFLVYRTGDRDLAEDLLADTFERALRGRRGFDRRRASERTWLYSIALNLIRDRHRRAAAEGRAVERSAREPEPTRSDFAAVEARVDLAEALDGLSAEEREAIALRFGAEMSVPAVAKLLGEPLTTIEGRVYRALRKLRRQLDK